MIRRLNYTDRKRIRHSSVSIALDNSTNPVSFNARFDLESYTLEPAARVFVEAYRGNSFMRFDFGTVGKPVPPSNRQLSEIEGGNFSRFRVKVVDDDSGRLLAATTTLSPDKNQHDELEPLLPLHLVELGNQVWKLHFDSEGVRLQLNRRIERIDEIAKNDPGFRALVFPAVVRDVLTYIIFVEKEEDAEEDEWSPWNKWLKFVSGFYPDTYPGPWREESRTDEESHLEWIDGAVGAFCSKCKIKELYQKTARWRSSRG